jgi:hypothetical protein
MPGFGAGQLELALKIYEGHIDVAEALGLGHLVCPSESCPATIVRAEDSCARIVASEFIQSGFIASTLGMQQLQTMFDRMPVRLGIYRRVT